ncbi:hypothetical protein KY334_05060 [Candidatus Woesearchaeota archaeon]|nr:hypothetical protein [Candidatus Woesearchaeota archaeon]
MNFDIYLRLQKLYQSNDFEKLLEDSNSLLFLKIRSIARKELLIEFANVLEINSNQNINSLVKEISNHQKTEIIIDSFINKKYFEEKKHREQYKNQLISELYKLRVFDWGGLYQNNLEKTIIDNYVKKIRNFDVLIDKVDNEIHQSLKGYVFCSWFNHWTSILIEDIFKDHKRVLPTVGLIKKVDFFIDNIPFDLKVTYFPEGFMKLKRKERGLKPELTELKRIAKNNNINFDRSQKSRFLLQELLIRFSETHLEEVKKEIENFHKTRWDIIKDTIQNKRKLIKWLYEEQGERRFDSSNRLFLVLIDQNNLEESWKLKRNIDFLKENIKFYLDNFKITENLRISFIWKGKKYSPIADILFIVKH